MDTFHNPRRGSHGRPPRPLPPPSSPPTTPAPVPSPSGDARTTPAHRRNLPPTRSACGCPPPRPATLLVAPARHHAHHSPVLSPALSGTPWRLRRHQPPCPGGQPRLKPGACITAERGESLLVSLLLVYCSPCTCLLA